MENCFLSCKSQLLMGRVAIVWRPLLASAPKPATMYWALGFLATYATILPLPAATTCPAALRAFTALPVFGGPLGFTMARSPAGSPLRLASILLCTVAYC